MHALAPPAKETVASPIGRGRHSDIEHIINKDHSTGGKPFSALAADDYHRDSTQRYGSVPMNQPSIVCMLFSTKKNKDKDDVDVFQFLGGDALWDIEATVAWWVAPGVMQGGVMVKDETYTADIPMMKASQ